MEAINPESSSPERPMRVMIAVYLLSISLTIAIIYSVYYEVWIVGRFLLSTPLSFRITIACILVTNFALQLFLIIHIWRRKNWARIALLVFSIVEIVGEACTGFQMFNYGVLNRFISIITFAMIIVALILLFTGASKAWFRNGKSGNRQMTSQKEI